MNTEELQVAAFEIILNSGNARSIVHEAFDAMREKNYILAEQKLQEANDELLKAHQAQTDLLQEYASGTEIKIEIIMVHAQDHYMTSQLARDLIEVLIDVFENK